MLSYLWNGPTAILPFWHQVLLLRFPSINISLLLPILTIISSSFTKNNSWRHSFYHQGCIKFFFVSVIGTTSRFILFSLEAITSIFCVIPCYFQVLKFVVRFILLSPVLRRSRRLGFLVSKVYYNIGESMNTSTSNLGDPAVFLQGFPTLAFDEPTFVFIVLI